MEPKIKILTVVVFSERDESYVVGRNGVTEIRKTNRDGMYCHIPYIEVWKGEHLFAEFCQHNVVGVWYEEPTP